MDANAVYNVRINQTLRLQQLLVPEYIGKDADISTIRHCQDFEDSEPVRVVYTEVDFESETPPMHLVHVLVHADDDEWLDQHRADHPGYSQTPAGLYWNPNPTDETVQ